MLIVTKGSQLKMKFNLIVHKCDTIETSCNCIDTNEVCIVIKVFWSDNRFWSENVRTNMYEK